MLSYENVTDRTMLSEYYFAKVQIKDYNVTIDQLSKNYTKIYDSIRKFIFFTYLT